MARVGEAEDERTGDEDQDETEADGDEEMHGIVDGDSAVLRVWLVNVLRAVIGIDGGGEYWCVDVHVCCCAGDVSDSEDEDLTEDDDAREQEAAAADPGYSRGAVSRPGACACA